MNPSADLLCATTARWLAAVSAVAGALGGGAAIVAAAILLLKPTCAWAAVATLLLVLPERLLALRTRFDAGLFVELSARVQALASTTPADAHTRTLADLDDALAALGLRPPSAGPRGLVERVQGARRLATQHVGVSLLQFSAVVAELLALAWTTGRAG